VGAAVKRFTDLPVGARVYICAIIALGAAAAAHTALRWEEWSTHDYHGNPVLATLVLLALSMVAGTLKVELADRAGRLNLGLPMIYLAMLLRGAPTALLCAIVDGLASSLLRRKQCGKPVLKPQLAHRILFNVADLVLCVYVSGALLRWLRHGRASTVTVRPDRIVRSARR
jgi:hypothetical protein